MKQRRHLLLATAAALAGISAANAASLPPVGNWQGAYRCAQGKTALDLAITAITPSSIRAVFYFHALAANPAVPPGCFMMRGRFDAETRMIELSPASWLDRPPSFVSVGLRGRVSASGQSIQGIINGPACATFLLARDAAAPMPPAPAPCRMQQGGPVT